jgi:hypothetical protein
MDLIVLVTFAFQYAYVLLDVGRNKSNNEI